MLVKMKPMVLGTTPRRLEVVVSRMPNSKAPVISNLDMAPWLLQALVIPHTLLAIPPELVLDM
jgi:hypothetical protein